MKRPPPAEDRCPPQIDADTQEIERTLRLFLREPGQVTEIRVILKGKGILSGYFDDIEKAAEGATAIKVERGAA